MNMLSILKKELRGHFSSLIAYVVIAMFLIVAGYSFYTYLVMFLTFVGSDLMVGLWQYTFHYLRFAPLTLIPLLTMRLFAEEKKMGTIELLFTAPLRDIDIILGKYFACLLVYIRQRYFNKRLARIILFGPFCCLLRRKIAEDD